MYCPRCGIENAVDARTCVSCGNDLRRPAERDPYQDTPHPPVYRPDPPPQPQPVYQPQPGPERVSNYLGQSITLAVVGTCCWIVPTAFAIPAIVFGTQVNSKLRLGDTLGAAEASRNARIWCWLSFGVLVLMTLVLAAFIALPFLLGV